MPKLQVDMQRRSVQGAEMSCAEFGTIEVLLEQGATLPVLHADSDDDGETGFTAEFIASCDPKVKTPASKSSKRKKGFLKAIAKAFKLKRTPKKYESCADQSLTESETEHSSSNSKKPPKTISAGSSSGKVGTRGHASSPSVAGSEMSSLSGTRETSRPSRLPFDITRQESIGAESLVNVRRALQHVDDQLRTATSTGNKVSRQKLMLALFSVAESLDDEEEMERIKLELTAVATRDAASGSGVQPSGGADGRKMKAAAIDNIAVKEASQANNDSVPPFAFFSPLQSLFHVKNEDKNTFRTALHDLMWTDVVRNTSATTNERSDGDQTSGSGSDCDDSSGCGQSDIFSLPSTSDGSHSSDGSASDVARIHLRIPSQLAIPNSGNSKAWGDAFEVNWDAQSSDGQAGTPTSTDTSKENGPSSDKRDVEDVIADSEWKDISSFNDIFTDEDDEA